MTTARRSALTIIAVLGLALCGGIAVSGSAAALNASTAAPYPHSPGTSAQEFPVSVVAQQGDAITQNGMKSMTLDFSAGNGYDGSVKNVSTDSVDVTVIGNSSERTVGSYQVSTRGNGQVNITFQRPVSVRAGDRIVADVGNTTTPSTDDQYTVGVSTSAPSGRTDGPVPVNYQVVSASLSFANQSASQFVGNQSVNVSGVIPNAGYIGVFTENENGTPGELVGNTKPILATYDERNYSVPLDGNVKQSQPLVAVAYYETSGSTQSERLNESFDPSEDAVVKNDGVPVNATGYVTTVNADARVTAGDEYDQGERLYFSQGDPQTGYQLKKLANGQPGQTVNQFETGANGSAVINTADLSKGQYVITRVDDNSVVGLDNDSTTSAQDDSFFVTGQTYQTTAAGTTNAGNASGNESTTAAGGAGNASANASAGNESGNESGGSTSSNGPGFGVIVAVVALLGAALLAVRRGN